MYYLIEITNTNSGIAKTITEKNSLNLATMNLHQVLASAMANENVVSCMCMIIDAIGTIKRYEYWEREAELEE